MALAFKQSKLDFLHLNSTNLQSVFMKGMAMFFYQDLAAPAVAVHAAVASSAANAFPGPITSPAFPKSVRAVFAALYDGGDIYLTGYDQFGRYQTETITAVANSTVEGVNIWKTISSIAKQTVGATANTVTMQTGLKVGIPVPLAYAWGMECHAGLAELAAAWDATYHSFTPTTAPDGSVDFTILVPVDWAKYKKMVVSEQADV